MSDTANSSAVVDLAATRDDARNRLTVLLDEGCDDLAATLLAGYCADGVPLMLPELAAAF